MMAEVIGIRGATPAPGQANPDVVDLLRFWLEMAERGEILAVAVAGVEPGNTINFAARTGDRGNTLIGATSVLLARMTCSALDMVQAQ